MQRQSKTPWTGSRNTWTSFRKALHSLRSRTLERPLCQSSDNTVLTSSSFCTSVGKHGHGGRQTLCSSLKITGIVNCVKNTKKERHEFQFRDDNKVSEDFLHDYDGFIFGFSSSGLLLHYWQHQSRSVKSTLKTEMRGPLKGRFWSNRVCRFLHIIIITSTQLGLR